MTDPNPDGIEKRLEAGEWLSVPEVTTLLKPHKPRLSRTTVHRWLIAGKIGYKQIGNHRVCDPADVRRILDKAREVRHGVNGSP